MMYYHEYKLFLALLLEETKKLCVRPQADLHAYHRGRLTQGSVHWPRMRPRTLERQGKSCQGYQRGYPWPERLPRHDGAKDSRCPPATREGRRGNHCRNAETKVPRQRRATAAPNGNVHRTQPENGSIAGQGLQAKHAERLQHFGWASYRVPLEMPR